MSKQPKVIEVDVESISFPSSIRLCEKETAQLRKKKSKVKVTLSLNDAGVVNGIYTGYSRYSATRGGDLRDHFTEWRWYSQEPPGRVLLTDPFVFEAVLQPKGSYRGRSAFGGYFNIDGVERSLQMGGASVIDLIPRAMKGQVVIDPEGVHGLWHITKKGSNVHVNPYYRQA